MTSEARNSAHGSDVYNNGTLKSLIPHLKVHMLETLHSEDQFLIMVI